LATFLLPTPFKNVEAFNETVTSSINLKYMHPFRLEITFRICCSDEIDSQLGFEAMDRAEDQIMMESRNVPMRALNRLVCRSCGLGIVKHSFADDENHQTLKDILPLPKGHWDEINDYISCFESVSNASDDMVHIFVYLYVDPAYCVFCKLTI
jgi:hypothetical protein